MRKASFKKLFFFIFIIVFESGNAKSLQIDFIGNSSPLTIKIFSYKGSEERLFLEQKHDSNVLFEHEINHSEDSVFRLVLVFPNKSFYQDILWTKEDEKLAFKVHFQKNEQIRFESNSSVNTLWFEYLELDRVLKTTLYDLSNAIQGSKNEKDFSKVEELKLELKSLKKVYLQKSSNPLYHLMVACSGANVDVSISYRLQRISKEALFEQFAKEQSTVESTPLYIDFFSDFMIYLDQQYHDLSLQDRKMKVQENLNQLLKEMKSYPRHLKYLKKMILEYNKT